jgi:hypothetical protein
VVDTDIRTSNQPFDSNLAFAHPRVSSIKACPPILLAGLSAARLANLSAGGRIKYPEARIHFTPKIRQTKAKNTASGCTFVFFLAASREPDILLLRSNAHFEHLSLVC